MSESDTTQPKNNNWKKTWKIISGVVLGLAAIGDARSGFQVILGIFGYLKLILTIPVWVLVIVLLICLIPLITNISNRINLTDKIKNIFAFLAIFSGILLGAKFYINEPDKKFVIVYDDEFGKPDLTLGNIEPEFYNIEDIFDLHTVGELNNAVFISTVSRPELKWKKVFPNNTKISSPIFSIQEVVDQTVMTNIVDISLSDFVTEISTEIQKHNTEIRIFYENGYESASHKLKSELSKTNISTIINEIRFDEKSFKPLLSQETNIVFLGNSSTFKNSIHNIDNQNYNVLIVPNWIRPTINPKIEYPTNRICALSKTFDKLVANDFETWKNMIDIIKDEDFGTHNFSKNIETKIRSRFATNNQVFITHF